MQSNVKVNLDSIPCGFLATNLENKITAINATLCQWLAVDEDEIIGQHIKALLTKPSQILFLGNILPTLQQNLKTEENYLQFKVQGSQPQPFMVNVKQIEHDGRMYFSYALMKMDRRYLIEEQLIKERKRAEEISREKERLNCELQSAQQQLIAKQDELLRLNKTLQLLTVTDSLTGLPNRRAYDQEIERKLAYFKRHQRCFCLIIFDIDRFKHVNDTFGHDSGDSVLKQIAQVLQLTIREIDVLARIGGEEFAIILPNTGLQTAAEVAERCRSSIHQATFVCGQVTASFGVADSHKNDSKEDIYRRADESLYQAKQQGRNQVVMTSTVECQ